MDTTRDEAVERLRAVIAAWGADPDAWPEPDQALLEVAGVREALEPELADARRLDALLRDLPSPPPLPDAVEDAVLAAGLDAARKRRSGSAFPAARRWLDAILPAEGGPAALAQGAAAAVLAVAVGAALGQMTPVESAPEDQFYALAAADPLPGFGGDWSEGDLLQ